MITQKMSADTIDGIAWAILKIIGSASSGSACSSRYFDAKGYARGCRATSGDSVSAEPILVYARFSRLLDFVAIASVIVAIFSGCKASKSVMRNKKSQKSNAQASTPSPPPPTTTSGAGTYQISVSFVPSGTPKKVA